MQGTIDYIDSVILSKKIYFTVKTDTHTYYFESDCQKELCYDLTDIMYNLFKNETYDDWTVFSNSCHITFSNQLPKGILL